MKITHSIALSVISCFLVACGSDSSSTQTSSNTGTSDISSIYTANANYSTKLAPTELLDGSQHHSQWDLYNADGTTWSNAGKTSISQATSDISSLCVKPTNKYSQDLNITVADLETLYEDHFCQLNAKQGITLNTKQCQDNINFIKNQSDTGNFNLNAKPILNNPLGIKSVSFMPINYSTTVPLPTGNQTFNVSGGLIMPNDISKSNIKGVAVYFHGTTFNKSSVGSNWCNPETQLVAAVFASQGYIVVMPDYVGQGADWQDVHPYVLYPKVSAKTAADMLSSVKSTIQTKYGMSDLDVLKLFSFGYSEGGAYSLWFNTYLRDNPSIVSKFYSLTHSVGMEGAYSTSNVIKSFLFDDVTSDNPDTYNIQRNILTDAVKPLLSADALLSYATYSKNSQYTDVLNSAFYNLECKYDQNNCKLNGQSVNMSQAFATENTTMAKPVLFSAFDKTNTVENTTYTYMDLFGLIDGSNDNNVSSLVSSIFFNNSEMSELTSVMQAADVNLTNVPDAKVSIITLTKDSVVTPNNYTVLKALYPSKFYKTITIEPQNIKVRDFTLAAWGIPLDAAIGYVNVDHMHALIYEYPYVLNILNQQ